jgi:glycosyltransferase involved in cell wall biosynthesis
MNAFTGGCHYDHGCGRFTERCGRCPQLGSSDDNDLSRSVWERKKAAFADVDRSTLVLVGDSYWLAHEARRSALLGRFRVETIHYGLDTVLFAPRDQQCSRSVLNVPQDAKVLLFAAHGLNNRRKGLSLLAEALSDWDGAAGLFLLSLGRGSPAIEVQVPHRHLGYINDDRLLSFAYSAADVFAIPSLQEAFGQTALEAMACGTPVVGFDVGGIPDMVQEGVTGLLAPVGHVAALRDAIAELLERPESRARMSLNCRRIAVEHHALAVQARRYVELYQSLLDK